MHSRRFFIYMFYVEFYMFQIEIALHVLRRFYVKHVEKKVLDALPKTVRIFRPGTWKLFLQLFWSFEKIRKMFCELWKLRYFFSARLTARVLPSFRLISSHFRRSVILEVNLTFFYLRVLCRICLHKTCRKKCRIQKLFKMSVP